MGLTTDINQVYTDKAVVTIKKAILLTAIRLNSDLTKPRSVVNQCIKYCIEDLQT